MTAISPTDVRWYLSCPTAGTGYSGTGTPGNSLGAFMSTTQISTTPLDDLFLDLSGGQNAADQVDYQCVFVSNWTITGNTMKNPYVWFPVSLYELGGATVVVGMDPIGSVSYTSTARQAQLIAQTTSVPTTVTSWFGPSSIYTAGCPIPDIPPGFCVALWLQRTAMNTTALTPQSVSLQITFASNA